MGIGFVDNIYTCLCIVWLKKRSSVDVNEQINLLQTLSMNELVECLCPLTFIVSYVAAFYGPNYEIFGQVGSNLYHYQSVDDIEEFLGKVWTLFLLIFRV